MSQFPDLGPLQAVVSLGNAGYPLAVGAVWLVMLLLSLLSKAIPPGAPARDGSSYAAQIRVNPDQVALTRLVTVALASFFAWVCWGHLYDHARKTLNPKAYGEEVVEWTFSRENSSQHAECEKAKFSALRAQRPVTRSDDEQIVSACAKESAAGR